MREKEKDFFSRSVFVPTKNVVIQLKFETVIMFELFV